MLRLLPGNVAADDGHLICFARDGCETTAGVDLSGFRWYQKQAGLAGVSSKILRAPRPDPIGAFGTKVEPTRDHSIVAGFLGTRIVPTGISSARHLAWMTRGGACSDAFAQLADGGAGRVGTGGRLLPVQHQPDDPNVLLGSDVSESPNGERGRLRLHHNCDRRGVCFRRHPSVECGAEPIPAYDHFYKQCATDCHCPGLGHHCCR
jgi:hypothetical protein